MSKFYNTDDNDYGQEIEFNEVAEMLNSLVLGDGYGVLVDCIIPKLRRLGYPYGVSKPIPLLKAIDLKDSLMLVMVEYKLYVPDAENDEELALEIDKSKFKTFKNEDKEINFLYEDKEEIRIDLHNSFDFNYDLEEDNSIPTISLIDWATSPFI
ncbi:hypothetical protein [Halonatronum saccharophilum]|uniref:hypothetical protein n=1 Tax=Halonatronum saccharophilum TaxID=150060 RepID=UPI00047F4822|nr:hypothetical protein [Halonatronum saccharophilum]